MSRRNEKAERQFTSNMEEQVFDFKDKSLARDYLIRERKE